MRDRPLVSVLFTSYKHEKYLRECLDSALTQTYDNLEVIVVDDNSSDTSPEILKSYGGRIRLVLNGQNRGTYAVLNQALEMANGKYAAVLNSDDIWLPRKVELQVELMESDPNIAFCHTFGEFIDREGNVIGGRPMGFDFPRTPTGDLLHLFLQHNRAIASSVMMRVDLAREIGGFNESYKNLGDWEMWLRMSERGNVGFADEKLTHYRIHGANAILQMETSRSEELRVREEFIARADSMKSSNPLLMKRSLSHAAACLATTYSVEGRPAKARQLYIKSLKLYPGRLKSLLRYFLTFAPLAVRKRTL
ncbi:MAG: glycosyltransferase [Fimbriimonadales bacterium]